VKPSREQILANREALTDALAEGRIERYLNAPDSAAAWAQFRGFSPRGARASFDLTHDMGRPRFGLTGELMPFEKLIFHVGSDASFNTYRCSWSSARAGLTESARTIERARREILTGMHRGRRPRPSWTPHSPPSAMRPMPSWNPRPPPLLGPDPRAWLLPS
jgi:hypothetical protein